MRGKKLTEFGACRNRTLRNRIQPVFDLARFPPSSFLSLSLGVSRRVGGHCTRALQTEKAPESLKNQELPVRVPAMQGVLGPFGPSGFSALCSEVSS